MNSIPWSSPVDYPSFRRAKDLVNRLFGAIRAEGIIARQNYGDCAGCAERELKESGKTRYVFYSLEESDDFRESGRLVLRASDFETAELVRRLAESVGLASERWTGSPPVYTGRALTVWRPEDVARTPLLLRRTGLD
jgi:hypothetical protein